MKIFNYLISIIIFSCLSSCGKDESSPSKNISGEVKILDEFGQAIADRSGVKVTASSNSTQTSLNGNYSIAVPSETQELVFEKPYTGTYRLSVSQPVASALKSTITLGTQPIRGVLSIVVKQDNSAISVQGLMGDNTPQGLPPRKHRLFLNTGPVGPADYLLTVSGETNIGNDQFIDVITFDKLRAAGFVSGDIIRVKAYSDNVFADTYNDITTNKTVYPALSNSGSNIATFSF